MRQGSIDAGFTGVNRALEGIRLHQKIQRHRKKQAQLSGLAYIGEAPLKLTVPFEGFEFKLEGRADGLLQNLEAEPTSITIEEIKSTTLPLSSLEPDPGHWHWAQAKCYGYMAGMLLSVDSLTLMLTYVNVEDGEWISFEEKHSREELAAFFYALLERYLPFAKMDQERIRQRNDSAKAMPFPYPVYRQGQRELAVAIYKTIYGGKKIYVQAPTGCGKTISALFPAIKSLSEGLTSRIFYLTAKTITRQTAEDAFTRMSDKGLILRAVTLTAKDKICFGREARSDKSRPDISCSPGFCHYASGHYDRVNAAILDIVTNEINIRRTTIEEYAKRHCVCPYEFSLDLALFCDCIICDYNYIYDPKAQLKRLSAGTDPAPLLLHDESHNLVERAREMFSAALSREQLSKARKALRAEKSKPDVKAFVKALGKGIRYFDTLAGESNEPGSLIKTTRPEELCAILQELAARGGEMFSGEVSGSGSDAEDVLGLYFAVLDFLRTGELFDERFITHIETWGWSCQTQTSGFGTARPCSRGKQVSIKLLCLDPSGFLKQIQDGFRASVFFSATLTPLDYFKETLGGGADAYGLLLSSPFDPKNLCLLMDTSVSTLYKDRKDSYEPVADRIHTMASVKTGNYLIFFSSYEYMEGVWNFFAGKYPDYRTIVQERIMTEEEREAFLENFSTDSQGAATCRDQNSIDSLLGFAVLGGLFSEGIDLTGDKLIGVAVVGVGLPLITTEREALSSYYKQRRGLGFEYAYVYPGMNKVLQAAGRVIRTETDRGAVLLIDSRYSSSRYKGLFPPEWRLYEQVKGVEMIGEKLRAFWKEQDML